MTHALATRPTAPHGTRRAGLGRLAAALALVTALLGSLAVLAPAPAQAAISDVPCVIDGVVCDNPPPVHFYVHGFGDTLLEARDDAWAEADRLCGNYDYTVVGGVRFYEQNGVWNYGANVECDW